ncbi:MAG: PEGA domain-containing protein [Acidobacteriales bacterium]|nr:PEGA domain-containing protein [Terriglobales bacterium]
MHFYPRKALLISFVIASAVALAAQSTTAPSSVSPASVVPDGTQVLFKMGKTISSADAHVGDRLYLDVLHEVRINNRVVIAKGATAFATVITAQPKKGRVHDGKLEIKFEYVELADGNKAPLRAIADANSNAQIGLAPEVMAAPNSISTHESPMIHSKDMAFIQDSQIIAYVNGDTPVELTQLKPAAAPELPAPGTFGGWTQIVISSMPTTADVEIDGKYAATTPAVIKVASGEHDVAVRRAGYQSWRRRIAATGATVKLSAKLQQDGTNGSTLSNCWGGMDCADAPLGDVARENKARRDGQDTPDQRGKPQQ